MTTWHSLLADPDDLPPDNVPVLAYWHERRPLLMVAYRDRRNQEWYTIPPHAESGVPAFTPEAWMPLPAPPALDQEAA